MRNAHKLNIPNTICYNPHLFINRTREIKEYLEWCENIKKSKNNCLFLLGDKGEGKSSLLMQFKEIAEKQHSSFLSIHDYSAYCNSFGYNVFFSYCLPAATLLSVLYSSVFPRSIGKITGGSIQVLGFGGGLNYEPESNYDYNKWLKKIYRKYANYQEPLLFIIDDIQNIKEIEILDQIIKNLLEIAHSEYPDLNINFLLSGETNVLDHIKYKELHKIMIIDSITYKVFLDYLDVLERHYGFTTEETIKQPVYEESKGNFRKIISILQKMERSSTEAQKRFTLPNFMYSKDKESKI